MIDRKKIKSLLNQNIVEQIILAQDFEVKNHFFKIRDEYTASASIAPNGYIKDFGGEFSGDVFAFLKEICGMEFHVAIRLVESFTSQQGRVQKPLRVIEISKNDHLNKVVNTLFQGFLENKEKAIKELEVLFSSRFIEEFGTRQIEKFLGYDTKQQCLAYIFKDSSKNTHAIAYNKRSTNRKWIREKGSKNDFIITNLYPEHDVIVIAEGVSEPLILECLGISYVCFQSVSEIIKASENQQFLDLKDKLKNKKIFIIADNDEIGFEASKNLAKELLNSAQSVFITRFYDEKKGFDLRDLLLLVAKNGLDFETEILAQISANSAEVYYE